MPTPPAESSPRASLEDLQAENERLHRALVRERTQWQAFFTHALEGILLSDGEGNIFAVNPAASEMLGYTEDEIIERGALGLVDRRDEDRWLAAVRERSRTGRFRGELSFRRKDASVFPALVSSNVFDVDGEPRSSISFRDMSEQRALADQLRARAESMARLAMIDELTGLANRRAFMDALERQTQAAERDRRPFTVVVADLDRLKEINDEYGHGAGDTALQVIAEALRQAFRKADFVARLSGDEFVAMLNDWGDACTDADVAERVHAAASTASRSAGLPFEVGVSMGSAVYDPRRPVSMGRLLAEADAAMYESKRARRTDP